MNERHGITSSPEDQWTTRERTPPNLHLAPQPRIKILFALAESEQPTESLQRVLELSRVLDGDLHFLRVVPEFARLNPLFPELDVADAVRAIEETLRSVRSTKRWLIDVLGERTVMDRLEIMRGSFAEQVAAHAVALNVDLIAVPGREGRFGTTVTKIARASSIPVLVARATSTNETIVAATDLSDGGFPVLRKAAELGQLLDAPVVAVHNVMPRSVMLGLGGTWPLQVPPCPSTTEAQRARLARASEQQPTDVETVLANEASPVEAILQEARARNAGLVVVGTRTRGWFGRLMSGSVAAEVVNQAQRSVLVTPLDLSPQLPALAIAL